MSKFSLSSLRSRAMVLVLLAILPLLALTLYSYFHQRDEQIREAQRLELVAARNLAAIEETILSDLRNLLATVAQLPQVQRRDRGACNALFAELLKQSPQSLAFVAADTEGRAFASAPAAPGPVNYANRRWFQEVAQVKDLVIGEPVVGHITGKYTCNLAYPVLDGEGRFQGAIATQLDLEWLGSLLSKSYLPPSTAMALTDSSWRALFRYPEPEKYIGRLQPDPLVKAMNASSEGVAAGTGLPGDPRLFAFTRLSRPWQGMWLIIGLPRDWAVGPVNRVLWRNLICLGLVALFAMAAAWYGGGLFVVRPVQELQGITARLAAGDLTVRAGPDFPAGEIGLLAYSFDQMAASLQERTAQLEAATEKLHEVNNQLAVELEERRLAQEELARSNAELEQFAYIASHDLQEPLRMVSSFLKLLSKRYQGKLDSDADEFISFAADGAHRMKQLLKDLLTYSRAGTRGKPLVPIDCDNILTQALANLAMLIEESGAEISKSRLPRIQGDEVQLIQLFQNLLANAIKFRGKEAPKIQISAAPQDSKWIFAVRDNGIGIAPEDQERVFLIFQRLHRQADYPGTGLGLALCKKIVKRHGGRIWLESAPGKGSTFYFTLLTGEAQ